jgi:hypothetical protein
LKQKSGPNNLQLLEQLENEYIYIYSED